MAKTFRRRAIDREWLRPVASLLAGLVIGLILLAVVTIPRAGWTTHDVTTGSLSGYPDLTSHRYDMPVEQATRVAAQLASGLGGWRVLYLNTVGGELQAEARVVPLLPPQIVTLKVQPYGAEGRYSEVLIRSHSTFGIGDFGINARHIRALQTRMDDKLPRAE